MRHAGYLPLVFVLLLGCTPAEDTRPDSGLDPDSGQVGAGLLLQFEALPALSEGGNVGGDFDATIDEVEIRLADLRVIGDAAPGDERTSADSIELEWEDEDVEEIYFSQAPPGLYSQLLAEVTRFDIDGRLTVDGIDKSFSIRASFSDLGLSIGMSGVDLQPGTGLAVPIRVELDRVIKELDWKDVAEEDGVLTIDTSSPQIDSVRGKIREMFAAGASRPVE